MIDATVFFYITLGAAVFYAASAGFGGRRGPGRARAMRGGRRGGGRGRRRTSPLSLNTAVLFAAGFGVGGFFASTAALGEAVTLALAVLAGAAFGAGEALVLGALTSRQGSSAFDINDFLGATASVEISI